MREKAVIYAPTECLEEAATTCLEHGQAAGYDIEGICLRWDDAQAMALRGVVQVIIVADRSHLPPDRVPRIEIPGEMPRPEPEHDEGPAHPSPMRRRPRPID